MRLPPLAFLPLLLVPATPASAVVLDWVRVAHVDNPPDSEEIICCHGFEEIRTTGLGSVPYRYWISTYEVTNTQYAAFLNAVAATDPNNLMPEPFTDPWDQPNGIERQGVDGSYTYAPEPGMENKPVRAMNWFRAARFCNWLHNGQPTGPQDETTTEDGAYTLLGEDPPGVPRNPGAEFWIPNEDEWYKAAYYSAQLGDYWDFPVRSDDPPVAEYPPGGSFSANLSDPPSCTEPGPTPCVMTEVGAYVTAVSPYGTYDQAGNVWEILEDRTSDGLMLLRGGKWNNHVNDSASFLRTGADAGCTACGGAGFRVAREPPGSGSCGLGFELAGVLALLEVLRRRPLRRRPGA